MARKSKAKDLGRPADTDSEQTRQNIVQAAKACFGNNGFRATSNRDIAEKAGVTAATIYYYFNNKSGLFIAVHHEVQGMLLEVAKKTVERASNFTDGWAQIYDELFEIHKVDPDIARFNAVVRMEAMRNPEISQVLYDQDWRDIFHQLADLGVESGELDRSKERELRAVLSALNFGLVQHVIESSVERHEECIRGVTDLFRGDLIKAKKRKRQS